VRKLIIVSIIIFSASALWAQEKSQVKVKGTETNNGVVIVKF